jgi:hypothetical protein
MDIRASWFLPFLHFPQKLSEGLLHNETRARNKQNFEQKKVE